MEYEASEDSAVVSFSAKFPRCPMAADALEIRYRCVEDCEDDREERVVMTKCTSLSAWLESAQLEVRQRMRLIAEFSELQPFSESRVFRPRELTRARVLTPSVWYINSQTPRLDLGAVNSGVVVYKKHVIYIYKKMSGTRLSYARWCGRWCCVRWATTCARRRRRRWWWSLGTTTRCPSTAI